jgi:hypothetical protein
MNPPASTITQADAIKILTSATQQSDAVLAQEKLKVTLRARAGTMLDWKKVTANLQKLYDDYVNDPSDDNLNILEVVAEDAHTHIPHADSADRADYEKKVNKYYTLYQAARLERSDENCKHGKELFNANTTWSTLKQSISDCKNTALNNINNASLLERWHEALHDAECFLTYLTKCFLVQNPSNKTYPNIEHYQKYLVAEKEVHTKAETHHRDLKQLAKPSISIVTPDKAAPKNEPSSPSPRGCCGWFKPKKSSPSQSPSITTSTGQNQQRPSFSRSGENSG